MIYAHFSRLDYLLYASATLYARELCDPILKVQVAVCKNKSSQCFRFCLAIQIHVYKREVKMVRIFLFEN